MSDIQMVLKNDIDTILKFIEMGVVNTIYAGDNFDHLLEEARDKGVVSSESDTWFAVNGVPIYDAEPEGREGLTLSI